ncbi:MAG: DUF484 family protein [Paracoccus sp. (in: a-proteobacteria)]|jgi:uncharacterized protein YigA (DUF484 family)|uniref:DUF484 family protein n=2 Tax=Paracoccus TaxID=265 RepID=UPI000C48DBDB|nr:MULTISPECIES: DUF484 family protein [unclassified Paracoccus (in: a-proteobacteria)]MAN55274.1 hypothetical protein [Paracoccus sp. (in: a-proteobacteria)]MBA47850.1 hypothetical protein [Paracoccus sp. (in: a-proteobacteria)]HIC65091.1 DUF484 family protein [Paracoccus sp. (in: a-proteobacteria)]|tara:strand:- start:539 stop:1252 length:714 start_codon:yes stop_codon:yes gene_type:complete
MSVESTAEAQQDPGLDPETRDRLLADPGILLADRDLMRALVAARESEIGENVIDIRGRAMEALETRLDRLESQHENVIAAAYDNQSGTAVVHRAVVGLMESADLTELVDSLQADIAPLLRVETLRLVVEEEPEIAHLPEDVVIAPEGALGRIVTAGRRVPRGDDIVLRPASPITRPIHGRDVASEALLPLDLGARRPRAMLVMGSADPARFMPAQGTDLLRFFGQVFRLILLGRLKS